MLIGLGDDLPAPSILTDQLAGGLTGATLGIIAIATLWMMFGTGSQPQRSRGDSGRARRRTTRKTSRGRTESRQETVEEALERARARGREILAKKYRGEG